MCEWLMRLLTMILTVVSPEVRKQLVEFCKKFRDDARKTANPWDDVLADLLCWVLGVPE